MAYQYIAWRAEPHGQSEIKSMRSDAKGFTKVGLRRWINEQKANPECVIITQSRTDNQSSIEHNLYTKPGYADPCRIL